MVGYKGRFKDDPVYGTDRIGELTSMWSDHEIGRVIQAFDDLVFPALFKRLELNLAAHGRHQRRQVSNPR